MWHRQLRTRYVSFRLGSICPAHTVIGVYPFPDADPFIIHKRPEVYIIGNQPEFQTTLVGGKQ